MRLCPECMKPMNMQSGYRICKICQHYLNLKRGKKGLARLSKEKRVARWKHP